MRIVPLIDAVAARVERVRVLYLYPSDLTPALVDAVCATGVPYFDLSLQHVSAPACPVAACAVTPSATRTTTINVITLAFISGILPPIGPAQAGHYRRYWPRGKNSTPSPRTALTHAAAGRPSFIGRPVIFTFVPGLKSLRRMRRCISVLGPSASNPQVVTVPSALVTSTSSQEWGLVY